MKPLDLKIDFMGRRQVAMVVSAVILVIRFAFGLGAVTNLNQDYPWGIWKGFNVTTGVAFAGGAYVAVFLVYILGLERLSFQKGDVHEQSSENLGQFDVVLMLGLLYHLENPVGALRVCRELCSDVCIIETQVVPGMSGFVDYGSYQYVRPLKGSFGVIDEMDDTHGPEASVTGICLVPSLEALMWLLEKVGFAEAQVLEPPEDAYEQLRYHKRVMVAARV